MATGAPDSNGIWIYGEDDSEATFSALINKLGNSTSTAIAPLLSGMEVRQIVQGSTATTVTNSTSTMADTGLSVTITPQYSDSKLLVIVNHKGVSKTAGAPANCTTIELLKNNVLVDYVAKDFGYTADSSYDANKDVNYFLVQTSGVTSALTYKTRFRNFYNNAAVYVQDNGLKSTITVIEVRP